MGLSLVEKYGEITEGPVGLRDRRMGVEPVERMWALACAGMKLRRAEGAADQLRGISAAERLMKNSVPDPIGPDFRMLLSQSRAGGMAAYWTLLLDGDLVYEDGRLTPEGKALAEELPTPSELRLDELCNRTRWRRVKVPREHLIEWGKACHLGRIGAKERKKLCEALLARPRRAMVFRALETMRTASSLPEQWRISDLQKLREFIEKQENPEKPIGLSGVLKGICAFERLHDALLSVFDTLRWKATHQSPCSLSECIVDEGMRKSLEMVRKRGKELKETREELIGTTVADILKEFAGFYDTWMTGYDDVRLLGAILKRHEDVQAGKTDGSSPKLPWLKRSGRGVLRPSPKRQVDKCPGPPNSNRLTHPYRLEQFMRMLQEVGELEN
jgi:hypothetical protein